MRIASKRASAVWIPFLASVVTLAAGCFKPNVQSNGFICADGGVDGAGTCPEGFHCAPNHLCEEGPKKMCLPAAPHIDPIPNCTPDPGYDCDPLCQSRCECGRCTLAGNKLACTPPGTQKRGAFCDIANDNCEPGSICLNDCGKKVARCYRFCGSDSIARDDICPGQCNFGIDDANQNPTGFTVCDPPSVTCNPVGDTNTDCGDPALYCYVLSMGATACDCKGTIAAGASGCGVYNSCVAGYSCVSLNTPTGLTATCLKTCRISGNDCTTGGCMRAGLGDFGYCPP